ncbi:MAG TPA: thiosulfate oxidation carrier protein SoxY [Burkholderiales bacterium]|nr:thiosulfate oxidation carrier protein SoxY [Burkholderiales bacterium]
MHQYRRKFVKAISAAVPLAIAAAAGLLRPATAFGAVWNKTGFDAKGAADALKSLGVTGPQPSKEIVLSAPDIAENGAQVPITVTSKIPNTQSISIVVDKNPFPLNSTYEFANGADSYVSTKLKMGQTSNVIAVIKADGKFFTATKEVKVTIGGCGG